MIDVVPAPSALRSTMRQRQTCFCGEDGFEMTASSPDRSSLETVKDIPVRISMTHTASAGTESQSGLLRHVQSNRKISSDASANIIEGILERYSETLLSKVSVNGYLRSFLGRLCFLFARCFYFSQSEDEVSERKKELLDLSRYYDEYRPNKVVPYDDIRFAGLFEVMNERLDSLVHVG